MSEVTLRLPRSRTLVHPGPLSPVRIQSLHCASSRHFRLLLQPGLSLFEAIVRPLADIGVHHASLTLLGGEFESLSYCLTMPDPTQNSLFAYTAPLQAARAGMIFGNATLGIDASNRPIVHCHAAFSTEAGDVRGGHIVPQTSRVGRHPLTVLVTVLEGFELRMTFDPETNMALLQPQEEMSHV